MLLFDGGEEMLHLGPVGNGPGDFDDGVGRFVLFGVLQQQVNGGGDDLLGGKLRAKTHIAQQLDETDSD